MALSHPDPGHLHVLQRAALLVLIGASLTTQRAAAATTHIAAVTKNSIPTVSKDARKLPVDVFMSHVEYKGDSVELKDVIVTQGETKVQADRAHATGLDDFDNSRWTFDGNVRINGEQHGSLRSDQAVVEFRNNRILKATATGNPAEFAQKHADTDLTARGRAKEIVYDLNNGIVRLSNDAWVSDGGKEISAPELVYNIREHQLQAATQPGSDARVHLHFDPKTNDDPNKKP
jgi:lipopolysaccharide transport protein LptA